MICPLTNKPCNRPKPYHITEVHDGKTFTFDVCEECLPLVAQAKSTTLLKNITELLHCVLGNLSQMNTPQGVCPKCNCSLQDIMKMQRVGCPNCYDHFEDELEGVFKNCQAGLEHVGKVPKNWKKKQDIINRIPLMDRIERVELQLMESVKTEAYEKAAQLRDAIKIMRRSASELDVQQKHLEDALLQGQLSDLEPIKQEMKSILTAFNEAEAPFI